MLQRLVTAVTIHMVLGFVVSVGVFTLTLSLVLACLLRW
jgi:hypothetical protein